jgi:hypothetical protein
MRICLAAARRQDYPLGIDVKTVSPVLARDSAPSGYQPERIRLVGQPVGAGETAQQIRWVRYTFARWIRRRQVQDLESLPSTIVERARESIRRQVQGEPR